MNDRQVESQINYTNRFVDAILADRQAARDKVFSTFTCDLMKEMIDAGAPDFVVENLHGNASMLVDASNCALSVGLTNA